MKLAITGDDQRWGNWKLGCGDFEEVDEIADDLWLFKGTIPVPSRQGIPFKFILENHSGGRIYEGDNEKDNRHDTLIPGVWDFFIFKRTSNKSLLKTVFNFARDRLTSSNKDASRLIIAKFLASLLNHAVKEKTNLDDAVDFLDHCVNRIVNVAQNVLKFNNSQVKTCFEKMADERLQHVDNSPNKYEHFLHLMVSAWTIGTYSEKMKAFVLENAVKFSRYLQSVISKLMLPFCHRDRTKLFAIFSSLASVAAKEYCWILVHTDSSHTFSSMATYLQIQPKDLTTALTRALSKIPDILRSDYVVSMRFFEILLDGNSINDFYDMLLSIKEAQAGERRNIFRRARQAILSRCQSVERANEVIQSTFLNAETWRNNSDYCNELLVELLNRQPAVEVLKLIVQSPSHLLQLAAEKIDGLVMRKFSHPFKVDQTVYKIFADLWLTHSQFRQFRK